MQRYFLGLSIILAASIYAYTQRYSLVEINFENDPYVLRYDSWTQGLCTLNNTALARSLTGKVTETTFTDSGFYLEEDYLPVICEQPAASIKANRLRSRYRSK